MKAVRIVALLASVLMSVSALAAMPEQVLNAAAVKAATHLSAEDRAEQLALMGERLLTPNGLPYAINVFKDALKQDPKNERAGFYLAALGPVIVFRGIMTRVEPLVLSTRNAEMFKQLRESQMDTYEFFRNGPRDIYYDSQIQDLMNRANDAWGNLRQFMADRPNLRLVLNTLLASTYKVPVAYQTYTYNNLTKAYDTETAYWYQDRDVMRLSAAECKVQLVRQDVYHVDACKYLSVQKVLIDYADADAIRAIAAGHQIAGILSTAYNLPGISKMFARRIQADKNLELAREKEAADFYAKYYPNSQNPYAHALKIQVGPTRVTDKEMYDLFTDGGGGELRKDNQLAKIRGLGLDLLAGAKALAKMQSGLCPAGDTRANARRGYLFEGGICLTERNFKRRQLDKVLAMMDTTLSGGIVRIGNGKGTLTDANLSAFYTRPVANIVPLLPSKFDSNGNASGGIEDQSLGGVLVHYNANQFYYPMKTK